METTNLKKVYIIGNKDDYDVWWIIGEIQDAGYEPVMVENPKMENIKTVVYCATKNYGRNEFFLFLAIKKNIRILPALFEGGRIPASLSDIVYADIRVEKEKGWLQLRKAIKQFI